MSIYEKYDPLLHGESRSRQDQILSVSFMRKYIHLAKMSKTKLTTSASEIIASEYSRLRSQDETDPDMARTQPVTARTLETLIRLSTAHARARLATTVTAADAQAAIELVQYAYFKKVLEKEKHKRRRSDADLSGDDETVENGTEPHSQGTETSPSVRRSKRTRTQETPSQEDDNMDDSHFEPIVDPGDLTRRETLRVQSAQSSEETPSTVATTTPDYISEERLAIFRQKLSQAFREVREQTLALERLTAAINEIMDDPFRQGEINAAIEQMQEANQIMVADGMVFLI